MFEQKYIACPRCAFSEVPSVFIETNKFGRNGGMILICPDCNKRFNYKTGVKEAQQPNDRKWNKWHEKDGSVRQTMLEKVV